MTVDEINYLKEKASLGDKSSSLSLVDFYINEKNYQKAFELLSRLEIKNDKEIYRKLGYFYELGLGVPVSTQNAKKYYQKAYELEDVAASYNLALIYYREEDYASSIPYLSFAVSEHHEGAIKLLSEFYLKGLGVSKNIDIAINLLNILLSGGDTAIYDQVGRIYYQSQMYEKAVEYFKKGVNVYDPQAMYHLAICFSKGEGVNQNIPEAIRYYELAANLNHLPSIYNLAMHYQKGIGVKVDENKANALLDKYNFLKNIKSNTQK